MAEFVLPMAAAAISTISEFAQSTYADCDNMFDCGTSPPEHPTPSSGHPSGDTGDDVGSMSQ
eukprot:9573825-Ditylum_brightwellii.AAC.1